MPRDVGFIFFIKNTNKMPVFAVWASLIPFGSKAKSVLYCKEYGEIAEKVQNHTGEKPKEDSLVFENQSKC